jgi:phage replication O-like protein O
MNGFTKINNQLWEWLAKSKLGAGEVAVLCVVIRKTIAWNKESDKISGSTFVKMTGLSKRGVIYSINKLVNSSLLVVDRRVGRITKYSLSKLVQSVALVQSTSPTSAIHGTKPVQWASHTKDNTKETNKKHFKIEMRNGTPIAIEQIINSRQP